MIFHLNTLYVDIKQTMYAGNKSYNYDLNTLYVDIKPLPPPPLGGSTHI